MQEMRPGLGGGRAGDGRDWRHLDIEYDKGSSPDSKVFDLAYDGPRAWFSYAGRPPRGPGRAVKGRHE